MLAVQFLNSNVHWPSSTYVSPLEASDARLDGCRLIVCRAAYLLRQQCVAGRQGCYAFRFVFATCTNTRYPASDDKWKSARTTGVLASSGCNVQRISSPLKYLLRICAATCQKRTWIHTDMGGCHNCVVDFSPADKWTCTAGRQIARRDLIATVAGHQKCHSAELLQGGHAIKGLHQGHPRRSKVVRNGELLFL